MPSTTTYDPDVRHRVALVFGATIKTWVDVETQPGKKEPVLSERLAANYPALFEIRRKCESAAGGPWYWIVGPDQGWVSKAEIETPDITLRRNAQEAHDNPSDPAPYVRRGQVELGRKHWVAAIDAFTEALRRDPKNPAIYHERARAYTSGDRVPTTAASDNVSSDASVGPERPVRDYGRALGDLTEELRLNPDAPLAYLERSLVFLLLAEREWQAKTATDDRNTWAAIYRSRAIRDLDRARALDSLVPGITEGIGTIQCRLTGLKVTYFVSGEYYAQIADSTSPGQPSVAGSTPPTPPVAAPAVPH